MTLMQRARGGETTGLMEQVAAAENVDLALLRERIAAGTAVLPCARANTLSRPCGIGEGLGIKVNANLGTSRDICDADGELRKLAVALAAGADAVMDLSTGGDLRAVRAAIRAACPVPLGSVPIYEALADLVRAERPLEELTADAMLEAVRRHGEDGVDFVTVHTGVTRRTVELLARQQRLAGVVSRGGSALAQWIQKTGEENPFHARFDDLLALCREYDLTLSLGDGLRPGCLADAGDRPQVEELYTLGTQVLRCREAGVQCMVEGPGHVPLQDVEAQVRLQKVACHDAPFYVLGPLVTDVAPGYDHIAGAIGGALAAWAGADFLCYLTPAEHLRLPDEADVKAGVMASRIAAHAADIARGRAHARDWDDAISRARKARDWEGQLALAMDPDLARERRLEARPGDQTVCTMCSELCALKGEGGL